MEYGECEKKQRLRNETDKTEDENHNKQSVHWTPAADKKIIIIKWISNGLYATTTPTPPQMKRFTAENMKNDSGLSLPLTLWKFLIILQ